MALVTGSTRVAQIYEMLVGMNGVAVDAQIRADLFAVLALTAGGALTPVSLIVGGGAPITTANSAPTGVTVTGISILSIAFNSRATIRWAALDADSRIILQAGGGVAGTLLAQNQQPGAVPALSLLRQIFFVE
jgi:hypothetical protein